MLLTITTTHTPATDLSWLLHKHPTKCQEFDLSFGKAYSFYPEATDERCTAALLLDVDPVGIVRGRPGSFGGGPLDQYVNDRPYVASSFLSVAISKVWGTALQGRCNERPELVDIVMPFTVDLPAVPCRGGEVFVRKLFEPLGYQVNAKRHGLDPEFPDWGESACFTVELSCEKTLHDLLAHLYVLIPVLDNFKHYYVGESELNKLLTRGEGWLAEHPAREQITRRYLKYSSGLARRALAQLSEEDQVVELSTETSPEAEENELEKTLSLNEMRLGSVIAALKSSGAASVVDLGCGEGRLLRELLKEKQFIKIVGLDVAVKTLEIASERLRLEEMSESRRKRIELIHGSLMYRDSRLKGFDAAAVVEVIEHLDSPRLSAFERVVFEQARPANVVLTTPNREYNVKWEAVGPDKLRHGDHRFEWTREEFQNWAMGIAERFSYQVRFLPVGEEDQKLGPPTQMAIFERREIGGAQCR